MKNGQYLESAMQKLSSFLDPSQQKLLVSNSNKELKEEDINKYITLLNDKLNNLNLSVLNYENLVFNSSEESIELKGLLSQEVHNQEELLTNAKDKIIKLTENCKKLINQREKQKKEKEILEKEKERIGLELLGIEQLKKENEKTEEQIKKINIKNNEKELGLEEEISLMREKLKKIQNEKNQYEKNLIELKQENDNLKDKNVKIIKNIDNILENIKKIEKESIVIKENKQKTINEQKQESLKSIKLSTRLSDIEKIDSKFLKEIALKNQQMDLLRQKNQNLESKKLKYESLEQQISLEIEINASLLLEKKNLEGFLDNIIQTEGSKKIENKDLERFLDLKDEKNDDYKHLIEETNFLKMKIEELEDKMINEKTEFELEKHENCILKEKLGKKQFELNQKKLERKEILDKFTKLENDMKNLQNEENYKKIVNDVNNKEDKTIGFKQNSNNKSLFSPIKLRPPEK